jgi:hypothetical protein
MAGSDFFVWEEVVSAILNTPGLLIKLSTPVKDLIRFHLNSG